MMTKTMTKTMTENPMNNKKLIVGIIGTANTGKSTLINDIVNSDKNVSRNEELRWTLFGKDYRTIISEKGLKINRNGNEECQKVIHNTLLQNIIDAANEPFLKRIIMDRTIIDSFAYTYWHNKFGGGGISRETLEIMWNQVVKFSKLFDSLIYIPLNRCDNITVVDDKFRDTNFEYRKQIDKILDMIWLSLVADGSKMDVIYGSRDERVEWFIETKEYLLVSDGTKCSDFSEFDNIFDKIKGVKKDGN